MRTACIFLAGEITDYQYVKERIGAVKDPFIICADAGYLHAKHLGITPNAVIGDFDSVNLKSIPKGIRVIKHPTNKDYTDGQLAVGFAVTNGCSNYKFFGALGGRFDHTLANVFFLLSLNEKGYKAAIEDYTQKIYVTSKKLTLQKEHYRYVSLLALDREVSGVLLEGFKYPLWGEDLMRTGTLGLSNEIVEDTARIMVDSGNLIVIMSADMECSQASQGF